MGSGGNRKIEIRMKTNGTLPQIYLIRHGETAWSLSGQATGRTDIALTEQGERDARALASRLKGLTFAQVFTSPLQRARRTAELAGFGKDAYIDCNLAEWDYGAHEGRRTADIRAGRPGWCLFEDVCPGGETLHALSARAQNVIERIRTLQGNTHIFAHWDILRVLTARWLRLQPVKPAISISRRHP